MNFWEDKKKKRRRKLTDHLVPIEMWNDEEENALFTRAMEQGEGQVGGGRNDEEDDALLVCAVEQLEKQAAGGFEFNLVPTRDRRSRYGNVRHRVFRAQLREPDLAKVLPCQGLNDAIEKAFTRAIDRQLANETRLEEDSTLFINFQSDMFEWSHQSRRLTVGEWRRQNYRAQTIMEDMAHRLDSNQTFRMNNSFTLTLSVIHPEGRGSGRTKLGSKPIAQLLDEERSTITIHNQDQLCCARAIVTMKAYADEQAGVQPEVSFEVLRKGGPCQERLAKILYHAACVSEGPCGPGELSLFQTALPEYHIKVFDADRCFMVWYSSPSSTAQQRSIHLVKQGEHFWGVTNVPALLGKVYYCHDCDKGYDHEDYAMHSCDGRKCFACFQKNCVDYQRAREQAPDGVLSPQLQCTFCYRLFFGNVCQSNHLIFQVFDGKPANPSDKNRVCDVMTKCPACCKVSTHTPPKPGEKRPRHPKKHRPGLDCGKASCDHCGRWIDCNTHRCYMNDDVDRNKRNKNKTQQNSVSPTNDLSPLFVYADIEVRQDTNEHVPNLLCWAREDKCEDENDPDDLLVQSEWGEECCQVFLEKLMTIIEEEKRRIIVIFHNLKGYDGMFILRNLYELGMKVENQVCVGQELLSFRSGKLTFKDSLCFLPMPLAAFTKTFDLNPDKYVKGYFPHFFNRREHQDYVGPLPSIDYFDPDNMNPEERTRFLEWHARLCGQDYMFDLKHEMQKYCESDVRLLGAGCRVFRTNFEKEASFDPMRTSLTIASACMRYFRVNCLRPNTIALEPSLGWGGARLHRSIKALKWLHWHEHLLMDDDNDQAAPARIRHARNGGEHCIQTNLRPIYVDGYDEQTNTVYQFHGCYHHGCPTCYKEVLHFNNSAHPDRTHREVNEATRETTEALRAQGYRVVERWECDWDRMVRDSEDIQTFLLGLDFVEPLNPRGAFYGGRTETVCHYHEVDRNQEEQIRYIDVCSSYPWVNRTSFYPVGHPTILSCVEGTDVSCFFGIAKVTILAPRGLFLPVLPHRLNGKLYFHLCSTCAETESHKPFTQRSRGCTHTDAQRCMTGEWCTPELQKAVDVGYIILKIHEVWNFENKSNDLFTSYVDTWLKYKTEATGWPAGPANDPQHPDCEAARARHIEEYNRRYTRPLDPVALEKNDGRKAVAKLCLNSFWGKFGEQLNKSKTVTVTELHDLYAKLRDPNLDIFDVRLVNEDTFEVVYKHKIDDVSSNDTTNTFIAAFTTCWARLKLYSYLQQLGEQVLYMDTDSVIYRWKPGQTEIETGTFLGEMTNEIEKPGDFIVEFGSTGPKSYWYVTNQGDEYFKCKGFTASYRSRERLNANTMKELLFCELNDPKSTPRDIPVWHPTTIVRDVNTKTIRSESLTKRFKLTADKRPMMRDGSYRTYPYGYEEADVE